MSSSLNNAAILIADTIDQCIDISNSFAPEHLEIMTKNDDMVLGKIEHAGSIFVGSYALFLLAIMHQVLITYYPQPVMPEYILA